MWVCVGGSVLHRPHSRQKRVAVLVLVVLGVGTASAHAVVQPLRIQGLVAAVFTGFGNDSAQSLDTQPIAAQAQWLKATGVRAVFVGGTTGESLLLSVDERKTLTNAWVQAATDAGLSVIVHVGSESMTDVRALTTHACSSGAVAIAAMPPVFFKPATVDALALYLKQIAAQCALPLYYYHIPSMTNVKFAMYDLLLAVERIGIETFVGVKYTGLYDSPGFMDLHKCLAYAGGKYEVLCGRDEMMLEALSIGVTGFVGSQYNFAGDLYNDLISAFHQQNLTLARSRQLQAIGVINAWQGARVGVNGAKLWMSTTVVDVGPSRWPFLPLDPTDKADMAQTVKTWCDGAHRSGLQAPRMCGSSAVAGDVVLRAVRAHAEGF